MRRSTYIVLNVMSLLLVVAGLGLTSTFFFSSPPQSQAAVAEGAASDSSNFSVPVVQRSDAPALTGRESEPVGPVPEDKTLRITVPEMSRVKDAVIPYAAGDDEEALRNNAAIHLDGTGFPWEREANVYVAGHRLGYPGTDSFLAFYDLDRLEEGDEVFLTDSENRRYAYRVFKVFVVDPTDTYVTQPIEGKNILTLQTCTLPNYSRRLIVQAEKVA
jgi:sortase A